MQIVWSCGRICLESFSHFLHSFFHFRHRSHESNNKGNLSGNEETSDDWTITHRQNDIFSSFHNISFSRINDNSLFCSFNLSEYFVAMHLLCSINNDMQSRERKKRQVMFWLKNLVQRWTPLSEQRMTLNAMHFRFSLFPLRHSKDFTFESNQTI